MTDLANIWTIARKELRDALNNKWFLLYAIAFGGLALALSLLSQPGVDLSGYGRTAASLINLVLLFVPLVGLTLGAGSLAGERDTGVLDYLLAQPVARSEVLLGKYLGLAGALFGSLALGFGAAGAVLAVRGYGGQTGDYVITVLLACLLGLTMLSLGILVSTVSRRTSTALGTALFLWLLLTFISDLGVMGAAVVTRLPIEGLFFISAINPLQLFKMSSILTIQAHLEVLGPAGIYATRQFGAGLLPLMVGGLLIWVMAPLVSALHVFARQGDASISRG